MKSAHVPALKHDAFMLRNYGVVVSPRGALERRIVANLIAHLGEKGFVPVAVWDGYEEVKVHDAKSAMEVIFNLDEASLRIAPWRLPDDWHGILLVLGNGIDIVSDWNFYRDDRDGFDAAMDSFDAEKFA